MVRAGPIPRISTPRVVPAVPRSSSPTPTPRSSYASSVPATPAPSAPTSRAASPPPRQVDFVPSLSYDSLAHLIVDAPPAYTRRETPAPSYTPPQVLHAPRASRPAAERDNNPHPLVRTFKSAGRGVASVVGDALIRGGSGSSGSELFASSVRAERPRSK
ncbi:uncharacterized protein LOC62_01G000040 [Vanrija pseudolonga]|uniref:Uncharacterized protein n=1 Tax=Vanrija pseudolonga TaxID=143232 RepID=A0AAF0Y1Y8_9TREE|nr:hypothetical protein LOC62_01G000040 [Vanrija pseudolonga]